MKFEINKNTEYGSFMWFKNQEFNLLDVMIRYFMGEVKFKVS